MRTFLLGITLICGFAVVQVSAADEARFASVDIYLESTEPFAAWQFELGENNGLIKVVGIENGDSAAFARAPYYDRDAVQMGTADRIIVADYSIADTDRLPSGRTRIATVHLMLSDSREPDFALELITATRHDGTVIDAAISLASSTGSEQ